ncbi:MAG: DEAD/DEAH box helicase, partial [Roseovarius sp.]
LPLLERIHLHRSVVQVVVLCPTRELCLQVCRDLKSFAKYIRGLQTTAVYGGASISGQIRALKMGTHVLVATPGRLHDLLRRGSADLSAAACVVLDEADEMLGMGFEEDLKAIMAAIPPQVQKLLFSATMPKSLAALVQAFVADPIEIAIGARGAGAETVEHHVYIVEERDRYQALRRIVDAEPEIYGLIFCRTRQETQEVSDALARDGYRADALHGDLSQLQRDRVMQSFSLRHIRLLVATNVAARGLDISELSHVINFRLPDALEGYTHRSGRTGRAGRRGISSVLISPRERSKIPFIERSLGCKFLMQVVPDGRTVCAVRIAAWLERMRADKDGQARIEPFMSGILAQLESMSREELVARLLSAQFADFLEHYRAAPDLNARLPEVNRRSGSPRGRSRNPHPGRPSEPRQMVVHKPARRPVGQPVAGGVVSERKDRPASKPKRARGDAAAVVRPAAARKPVSLGKRKRGDTAPVWVQEMMKGGKKKKARK